MSLPIVVKTMDTHTHTYPGWSPEAGVYILIHKIHSEKYATEWNNMKRSDPSVSAM